MIDIVRSIFASFLVFLKQIFSSRVGMFRVFEHTFCNEKSAKYRPYLSCFFTLVGFMPMSMISFSVCKV